MPLEVLAGQAVEVLICPALPGAGAFREVDRNPARLSQFLVPGHLDPLVPGEASFQMGRQLFEHSDGCGVDARGGVVFGQVHDDAVLGLPLPERHHRGNRSESDDEVPLPVTNLLPVFHLGWALVNHRHIDDSGPSSESSLPSRFTNPSPGA